MADSKRRTSGLIVFAVLAGMAVWGIYAHERHQHDQSNREEAALRAKDEQTQRSISQLAARYNAVTDWRKALGSKTLTDPIYSAELRPLFVRADGRPVLFIVSLHDVTSEGDHYVIHLDGKINLHSDFRLVVESTPDQAKLMMSYPGGDENRYAVVGQIQSVDSAEKQVLDSDEGTNVKSISLAKGRCLDVMPLGTYFGDIDEIYRPSVNVETVPATLFLRAAVATLSLELFSPNSLI